MAPKRLTDPEKQEIIRLYRHPEETTSTLASRFGVSNSTISRILKQTLAADEYDDLVQQKRTGSTKPVSDSDETQLSLEADSPSPTADLEAPKPERSPSNGRSRKQGNRRQQPDEPALPVAEDELSDPSSDQHPSSDSSARRRRRRSVSSSQEIEELQTLSPAEAKAEQIEAQPQPQEARQRPKLRSERIAESSEQTEPFDLSPGYPIYPEAEALVKDLDEDLLDPEDDFTDLDEDDEDDEDDFADLEDDDDLAADQESVLPSLYFQSENLLKVQPFSAADLPRSCYLVIDRSAELITRPLEDFAELGQIPSGELAERTLPVFDNHRVAKRFANRRTQRIVKIPDSRLLQKATPYLQAKGITRLLIDGQVYAL